MCHRNEGHTGTFEYLDHLGEVGQAASETVNLVDHHDVNAAFLDVIHEPTQSRAFHVAARETAIVIVVCYRNPALAALAGDVGVTSFLLGIDGVEGLVQAFVAGHAAVNGAPLAALENLAHLRAPFFAGVLGTAVVFRPKNTGPDQAVPVISLAMRERLRYGRPSYS